MLGNLSGQVRGVRKPQRARLRAGRSLCDQITANFWIAGRSFGSKSKNTSWSRAPPDLVEIER